jgi:hypothetical protein
VEEFGIGRCVGSQETTDLGRDRELSAACASQGCAEAVLGQTEPVDRRGIVEGDPVLERGGNDGACRLAVHAGEQVSERGCAETET